MYLLDIQHFSELSIGHKIAKSVCIYGNNSMICENGFLMMMMMPSSDDNRDLSSPTMLLLLRYPVNQVQRLCVT